MFRHIHFTFFFHCINRNTAKNEQVTNHTPEEGYLIDRQKHRDNSIRNTKNDFSCATET